MIQYYQRVSLQPKNKCSNLFLLIVFAFISCKDNATVDSNKFDAKLYNENYIDFIRGTILLPKSYKLENPKELIESINLSQTENNIVFSFAQFISDTEDLKVESKTYIDKNNRENFIWVIRSEQFNFTKSDANKYLGMLEQNFKRIWGSINVKYYRLENKIIKTNKSEFIKIKYSVGENDKKRFVSNYIVSSPISTFGVWIINDGSEDFEELVKRINYNF
jgi:hypothetical protein